MQPFLAMILPVSGGHPDNSLPGGIPGLPTHPWVPPSPGAPDQGLPLPPGSISGSPEHPIYTPPNAPEHPIELPPGSVGGSPEHPIYFPVRPSHPIAPGGGWGGEHPGNRPPGSWGGFPARPDQGLPGLPPGTPTHPWVPPAGEELPPPPADIANNYVVAVWNPTKDEWKVTVSGPATPTPK
jgi:hypothetical protein